MHRRYHCGARNQPHTHSHTLSLYKKRGFAGRYIRWNGQDTIRLPGTGSRPRETTAGLSCLLTILLLPPLWRCCQLPWPRVCCSLEREMLTMRGQGPLLWALVMLLFGAIRVGGTGMESGVGGSGREYLQQTEEHWDGKTPWFTGSSCECNG